MSENRSQPQVGINDAAIPAVVDRATFQAELDALRVREKAHAREGDAIAAARRRLPMVEVDAATRLIGPSGPFTLLDVFEGRRQLIAYYFMWYPGQPAPEQCEGCTRYTTQIGDLSYLHDRDVTYATLCQGPYEESVRYREFMGWDHAVVLGAGVARARCLPGDGSACFTWCATCATATACSRPTGPTAAASRRWTTAMR